MKWRTELGKWLIEGSVYASGAILFLWGSIVLFVPPGARIRPMMELPLVACILFGWTITGFPLGIIVAGMDFWNQKIRRGLCDLLLGVLPLLLFGLICFILFVVMNVSLAE